MTNREKLWQLLLVVVTAIIAAVGSRYGLKVPDLPPITVNPPQHVPPETLPEVKPIAPPAPKPDAVAAIGRIQFGNSGCTATIIGPRRTDGRWWVLTASHCVRSVGSEGSMRLKDGRSVGLKVVGLDRTSDCCWCLTSTSTEVYPFALLVDVSPEPGTRIWHMGYGVDRPGNLEEGEIKSKAGSNGQISMHLSVSSGDSGGGICLTADNRVVSTVCCTSRLSGPGTVWGASPESIAKLRNGAADAADDFEWTPIPVPIRDDELSLPASDHRTELKNAVGKLVDRRFEGNFRKCFDHYAGDDKLISRSELLTFLKDAEVGSALTRGEWVSGVLKELDKDKDGYLSWTELSSVKESDGTGK